MMENEAQDEGEIDLTCLSQGGLDHSDDDAVESVDHVPYSFQCPAQLLTLRCAQFQKNISNYSHSLALTEEYFRRTFHAQFQDQILVTGLTFDDGLPNCSVSSSWKKDLVLSLGDISLSTFSASGSFSVDCFRELSKKLILIDKLDLAELLNCPKTISSCKDVVKCNTKTRCFELAFPFPFFLTGVDHLLSLLVNALSCLLQVSDPLIHVSYGDIQETLLEFPFWVHRNYAEAFLKIQAENLVVSDESKRVNVVKLESESSPSVFLCFKDGSCISPSVLLDWYRKYLVKRIVGVLSSTGSYNSDELSTLLARILA